MYVINLFGAPGVGKSTTASEIFSLLKKRGIETELCSEFAKRLVWSGRLETLKDSLYVFAKQNDILVPLERHGVRYAVTDCPLPLCLAYTPKDYYRSYRMLVMEVFHSYRNLNFYLSATHPYSTVGRIQNEEGSIEVDKKLRAILAEEKLTCTEMVSTCSTAEAIVEQVLLNSADT